MKDIPIESESILQGINATTQKKNTEKQSEFMDKVKKKLLVVAEDVYQFNRLPGGKMTLHSNGSGILVIVASLENHELGIKETDSGISITIDNDLIDGFESSGSSGINENATTEMSKTL